MLSLLLIIPIVLISRVFYIQIIKGVQYRSLSDSNRIRTEIVHAPRGIIFDRNGVPLVFNTPGFRRTVNSKIELLSKDEALSLIAKGEKNIEVDNLRQYPYKEVFAHVIGYIGQISPEELKSSKFSNYNSGDLIGKMGLEQEYESTLKGVDGKKLVEVDATGKTVRTLGTTDPIPGQDIMVTLDLKLQQAVYNAMDKVKHGAVVVEKPDGEVLALVSKPSFDANLFTLPSNYKPSGDFSSIPQILGDSDNQPLLDRAISGTYPPGSTFKLVNAAAGLASHAIDENWEIQDTGVMQVGAFSFANWYFTGYGRTEGMVNIVKAIKRSNDIFFYQLAGKIGVDALSAKAKQFGLGSLLGIDLEGEEKGLVPTQEWKQKAIGEPWFLGDTYHFGIGQGYLLTTPLQVNGWTQAIANGGTLFKPHLLKNVSNNPINKNLLDDHSFNLIREGMIEACDPGGVAWPLFEFRIKNQELRVDGKNFAETVQSTSSAQFANERHVILACKTGTAEHGDSSTLPHAWITLFAPAHNPQIVVTVLNESSGEGSNEAAPIAKKILEEWFSR